MLKAQRSRQPSVRDEVERGGRLGNESQNGSRSGALEIANRVLGEVLSHRRLLPGEEGKQEDFAAEAAPHLPSVLHRVRNQLPIQLILPGFPAKSPNRKKTLGPLPDLGEKVAIGELMGLVARIEAIYEPGARLVICSDGRVFSDLVKIPDDDVTAYHTSLRGYCEKKYRGLVDLFRLDDIFERAYDFDTMREELLVRHGESIERLRHRSKTEEHARAMYRGVTRFLVEDYSGLPEFSGCSRNAIQKEARSKAYRVIQRSNAWSRLLEAHFSHATRLSIHPQFRVSEKIGIKMGDADNCWLTPWHSVAVKCGEGVRLMKRGDAERKGLSLVFEEGRPSHFEGFGAA